MRSAGDDAVLKVAVQELTCIGRRQPVNDDYDNTNITNNNNNINNNNNNK